MGRLDVVVVGKALPLLLLTSFLCWFSKRGKKNAIYMKQIKYIHRQKEKKEKESMFLMCDAEGVVVVSEIASWFFLPIRVG